jgi:hypothetical protein
MTARPPRRPAEASAGGAAAGRPEPLGHPDNGRARTEDMLEKGLPPKQRRRGKAAVASEGKRPPRR